MLLETIENAPKFAFEYTLRFRVQLAPIRVDTEKHEIYKLFLNFMRPMNVFLFRNKPQNAGLNRVFLIVYQFHYRLLNIAQEHSDFLGYCVNFFYQCPKMGF